MSRTIDEKVVSMQFDNQQFESNVRQSMSTIEKLKSALRFDKVGKSFSDIENAASNVSFDQMANSVSALENRFSTLGIVGKTVIENLTNSAMSYAKKTAGFITNGIIQGGIARATNLENAHFQLQGLLKDEEKVQAVMQNVSDAVDGTAYSLDAAAKVASQLSASGMTAGDEMFKSLRGIAGVAAMTNSSYEDVGDVFTKVAGQGRVMADDLNRLAARGMNAAATLAESLGKSESEIRDMVSKGKIDFKTFALAMDDAFGEHAKKANETFNGALSNIKSALGRIGALFISPLIEQNGAAVKALNAIRVKINDIKKSLEPVAEIVTKKLNDTIGAIAEKIDKITIGPEVNQTFLSLTKIGGALINIFKALGSVLVPLTSALRSALFDTGTLESFASALSKITSKFILTSDESKKLYNAFSGIFSVVKLVLDVFVKLFGCFGDGLSKLTGIKGGFLDVFEAFGLGLTSLTNEIRSNGFLNGVDGVCQGIGKLISKIHEAVSKLGLFEAIAKFTANLFGNLGSALSGAVNIIGSALKSILSAVKDVLTNGDLKFALDGSIFAAILYNVKKVLIQVRKFVDKTNPFAAIGDTLKQVRDSLYEWEKNLNANYFIKIGAALLMLAGALLMISSIDQGKLASSLAGITVLMGELVGSMKLLSKITMDPSIKKAGGMMLAFSAAILILAVAMKKISSLSFAEIAKGLTATIALMYSLVGALKLLNKVKIPVKTSVALIALATALRILSGALVKISSLSISDIAKGLIAMGGALAELCVGLKIINKVKIPLKTSMAIVALAEACKILGDAFAKFGSLSWSEIGRGLVGMGGALLELVGVMAIMKKVGGFKSLIGSLGILILVQSLGEMADALKKFGSMSWGEIGRGLVAMGGALVEVGAVIGVLGYFTGVSSLFSAAAIAMVVGVLSEMADALKSFGAMSWDEIGRGLAAMGGALAEVATACGLLGGIAGFSSLFGAGAIVIVIQGLDELASALAQFGSMTWDEIERGLVGMGGALAEVATACGALGGIAGFSSLFGAGAIMIVIQGLDELSLAMQSFGAMSWDEIKRGLVGMGGALLELGTVSGVLGGLTGVFGMLGAGSLLLGIQGLGDLADALKKFGDMNWDEIGRGLVAMGAAMSEVALGGIINTFSGLGAGSISKIAEPLGTLADSVKKWTGVKVPEGLGIQLGLLGAGVSEFTFSGLGSGALAKAAEPLGVMADSVKKWTGVTVPDGLGDQLFSLADGISNFTFSGLGSGALAKAAEPLGELADSVQKWKSVTVPANLGDNLSMLAEGVKAFTWDFLGGASMSTVTKPLGELPDSINKWNDVKVPEGIKDHLTELADGVKAFSWAFMGSSTLDSVATPLGDLATAIKSWENVTVPEDMQTKLESLADGVKAFTWTSSGGASMSSIVEPLGQLATSIKDWGSMTIPTDLGNKLKVFSEDISSFAEKVKSINSVNSSKIVAFSEGINTLNTTMAALSAINTKTVDAFVDAINKIGNLEIDTQTLSETVSSISQSVQTMMGTMQSTIGGSKEQVNSAMQSVLNGIKSTIDSSSRTIMSAAQALAETFSRGLLSKKQSVETSAKTLAIQASIGINTNRSYFETAGNNLGDGLVIGINAKQWDAYMAGYRLGEKAIEGERDGQKSHSPSKLAIQSGKWIGEGVIIGLDKMGKAVYKSGYGMGETAVGSLSNAISKVSDYLDSGIDTQPTIRPVMDLTDISSGADAIGNMLDRNPIIGTMANIGSIGSTVGRGQNGANDDVIAAIKDLGRRINAGSGDTYNINGVSYNGEDGVADAIKAITRAALVERRR